MADHEKKARGSITRREAIALLGAPSFMSIDGYNSKSYAQSKVSIDQAVEWARKTLPASTPDIINAAAKEGRLTLTMLNLGGNDEALKGMIAGFNQRYPFIAVEFTMQSTIQLVSKFNAELAARKGITDYLNLPSNPNTISEMEKQGALLPFVISQDAAFPASAKRSGIWYTWRVEQIVTAYRKGALTEDEKKLVRTYAELGDSRFRGRIGIGSVSNAIPATATYILLHKAPRDVWTALSSNKPAVKASAASLMDGLLAGEYEIALFGAASTSTTAAQQGAPLEFGVSTPSPTLYTPAGISALAPHPNAARLWQDWVMSLEGQELWVRLSGSEPVRVDANEKSWAEKQPWYFDERAAHPEIDWTEFAEKQQFIVNEFKLAFQS